MEIKIETKIDTISFNELEIGNCFRLPDYDAFFYLRIKDTHTGSIDNINAICLNTFESEHFPINQKVIKIDATLTIYK